MAIAVGTKVIHSSIHAGTVIGFVGIDGNAQVRLTDGRIVTPRIDTLRALGDRGLTDDEIALLNHISMHGSAGYPLRKYSKRGHWSFDFRSIAHPRVYPTKREATMAFESYMNVLRDAFAGRV